MNEWHEKVNDTKEYNRSPQSFSFLFNDFVANAKIILRVEIILKFWILKTNGRMNISILQIGQPSKNKCRIKYLSDSN